MISIPVLEEGLEEELDLDIESIDSSTDEEEQMQKELELTESENSTDLDVKELNEAQEDSDWDSLINDEDSYEIRLPKDKNEEEYERPEVVILSMTDHLLEQLNYISLNEKEYKIGEYLIWNIKDDGYLDESLSLENVSHIFECDINVIELVLKKIQIHCDLVSSSLKSLHF